MRVLFWGTSAFAIPSLRALLGEGFEVVAAITQPDRPVGRSRSTLTPPPVKECAAAEGIPVLQPEAPRGEAFLTTIGDLEPEISVVVSYGHLLPKAAIELPPLGTVNVHASLLPKLRGAAPIQAAIRDGFIETGVTIMRMVPALDAGPIILQARTPIAPDETSGELELRLSELGALALVEALTLIALDRAVERAQDESAATYAPKIDRAMLRIPWQEGCGVVGRHVRAYDPRPGAVTMLGERPVKLFGAMETEEAGDERGARFGEVLALDERGMLVACGSGAVRIGYAQEAGGKRITIGEWARGRRIQTGDRFH